MASGGTGWMDKERGEVKKEGLGMGERGVCAGDTWRGTGHLCK